MLKISSHHPGICYTRLKIDLNLGGGPMTKLELLANVLEYIEQHISEDIHTEDIAKACFCSRSSLEKLFRCVYNISVRDYLIRRRMTHAGKT